MKKFKFLFLALLSCIFVSLVACNNDAASNDGDYTLESVTAEGLTVTSANADVWALIPDDFKTATVSGDNVTIMGETFDIATWEAAGATITFEGGKLKVDMSEGGETATYIYVKS